MSSLLLCLSALSTSIPPVPIDLSSAPCPSAECWTVSSVDGEGAIVDGHGRVQGVPALIPGEVHDDLMRSGVLADIWYGNGSTLADAAWVGWRTWHFSRSFTTPADNGNARWRRWLRFGGVQYNATIKLNDKTLGSHVGQFEPFEYDVTGFLRPSGEVNTLVVTTHPLLDNSTEFSRQISDTKTYTGQVSCWLNQHALPWMGRTFYGWDFVPAVFSTGIWRDVSLHTTGALLPFEFSLLAQSLNVIPRIAPPYTTARLELALEVELRCRGTCGTTVLMVRWNISTPAGARAVDLTSWYNVSTISASRPVQTLRTNLTLLKPALWWPNGYGKQPIYEAAATILSGGTQLDHISTSFGVRELTVGTNPHLASGWAYTQFGPEHTSTVPWGWGSWEARVVPPIPSNATAWQIRINGRPIFMRGGNWIPRDQLFGRGVRERNRTTQILEAAKHAGFTWMRVWGGGLIEDQHFYGECDRLGLMLLQEFPHAGCAPGGPGDSFPDYKTRLPVDDSQTRKMIQQLISHPSIVRYNYANEFYLNSSVSPFIAQFLATVRSIDDSRPVHEANPTCVAIRHGPYTFGQADYATYAPACGNGTILEADMPPGVSGCAGQGDNGGNPFEWDEFGATGLADIDTLRATITADELASGWQARLSPSWSFHGGNWWNVGDYRPVFSAGGKAAPTLIEEVRWSQFMQAEGLRFSFQAHRRAKPHRSAFNSWTFNEPWPNAAHGSMLSFSGVPKMAYFYARAAMAMVDISLLYSGLTVKAGVPLSNSSVSVWVDSELDAPLTGCEVTLQYIDSHGVGAKALLATEHRVLAHLAAATGRQVSGVGVGLGNFAPPVRMTSASVLLVRAALKCAALGAEASNDYTFGVVKPSEQVQALATSSYNTFPGLIPADRTNFTASLQGHTVCESRCNATAACVGYTTDQTATNCWLYDAVHALVSSPPDAFHLKPGVPVPPHAPLPPPPPPPPPPLPPPLAALVNVPGAHLSLRVKGTSHKSATPSIAFVVSNPSDQVALFVHLSLRMDLNASEVPYALFSTNFFSVLPGESKNATVSLRNVREQAMVLCAEAWNVANTCSFAAVPGSVD